MIPKDVVGGMIALAVNESFEVPYQFRIPPLADHPALVGNPPPTPPPSTAYCEQILFVASCQDVEGKPGDELRMGLRAQILVPSATPAGKAARNFTSLWRRLPESETAKIPVPRH